MQAIDLRAEGGEDLVPGLQGILLIFGPESLELHDLSGGQQFLVLIAVLHADMIGLQDQLYICYAIVTPVCKKAKKNKIVNLNLKLS